MADLTIAELKAHRKLLEDDLRKTIQAKLDAFSKETGIGVKGVYIPLLNPHSVFSSASRSLVDNVSVEVEL